MLEEIAQSAALLDLGSDEFANGFTLASRPDGTFDLAHGEFDIVVSGSTGGGDNMRAIAVAYTADGQIDTGFGPDHTGVLTLPQLRGGADQAYAATALDDGTVVLAGSTALANPGGANPPNQDMFVARLNADGTLATSFNKDGPHPGTATLSFGFDNDVAFAVAVQKADGQVKIVVAGQASNGNNLDFGLARFTLDGMLDTTFGGVAGRTTSGKPGTVLADFNHGDDVANAVAVQPDGKIVAVGTANIPPGTGSTVGAIGLLRLKPDGTIDETFGNGGEMTDSGGAGAANAAGTAVSLQPDGRIVVGGTSPIGGSSFVFLTERFLDQTLAGLVVAHDDSAATPRGMPVVIPVLANDVDLNKGGVLTVTGVTQGDHGRVEINPDGTGVTYTPNADFTGTDHFFYTAGDGPLSATATVTVHVFNAPSLRDVIDGGQHVVTDAQFVALSSPTAAGTFAGTLGHDPSATGTFALLTNGDVSTATDTRDAGVDNHTAMRGAFDVAILHLVLDVPRGMNYLSFDLLFASNEYPLYRNRGFNDGFVAELDPAGGQPQWHVDENNQIVAPDNFAFDVLDPAHGAVSVGSHFFDGNRVQTLTGTFYNGGTPLLQAHTPITPGRHDLFLSIFDVKDGQIDSAAFVNNLRVRHLPGGQGAPGATQPPIAEDDTAPLFLGRTVRVPVLANDLDFDRNPLRVSGFTQGAHGSVALDPATNDLIYAPAPGFNDFDSFTYTVSDGVGGTSTATVHLHPVVTAAASASAGPTDPDVAAAAAGVAGRLSNKTVGSPPDVLTVAGYRTNPVIPPIDATRFFDLRGVGPDSSDAVVAAVRPSENDGPNVYYFTGSAWEPVRISRKPGVYHLADGTAVVSDGQSTAPIRLPDGRLVLILDGTSQPRATGIDGTVFALGFGLVDIRVVPPPQPVASATARVPSLFTGGTTLTADMSDPPRASPVDTGPALVGLSLGLQPPGGGGAAVFRTLRTVTSTESPSQLSQPTPSRGASAVPEAARLVDVGLMREGPPGVAPQRPRLIAVIEGVEKFLERLPAILGGFFGLARAERPPGVAPPRPRLITVIEKFLERLPAILGGFFGLARAERPYRGPDTITRPPFPEGDAVAASENADCVNAELIDAAFLPAEPGTPPPRAESAPAPGWTLCATALAAATALAESRRRLRSRHPAPVNRKGSG